MAHLNIVTDRPGTPPDTKKQTDTMRDPRAALIPSPRGSRRLHHPPPQSLMRPAAPSADPALPSGPARHWRRLAWWSLFVAGNALAMGITLGNVPLADNLGGSVGLAYLAVALPGHLLAFGALAGLLPLLMGLWPRSSR